MILADHMWDKYYEGVHETSAAERRLGDLEANIGPELLAKLEEESNTAGGEQYCPKAATTPCKRSGGVTKPC